MHVLEEKLFEMYDREINCEHCRMCHGRKRKPSEELCPPKSFFILGKNLSNTNLYIRLAFVGKTHGMNPAYDEAICVNMKLLTLEKIYISLKRERYAMRLPPKIMAGARTSVDVMLETRESLH